MPPDLVLIQPITRLLFRSVRVCTDKNRCTLDNWCILHPISHPEKLTWMNAGHPGVPYPWRSDHTHIPPISLLSGACLARGIHRLYNTDRRTVYSIDAEPPARALPSHLTNTVSYSLGWRNRAIVLPDSTTNLSLNRSNEFAVPQIPRYHWSEVLTLLLNSHLVIWRIPHWHEAGGIEFDGDMVAFISPYPEHHDVSIISLTAPYLSYVSDLRSKFGP